MKHFRLFLLLSCCFFAGSIAHTQNLHRQVKLLPTASPQFLDSHAIYLPTLVFFNDSEGQHKLEIPATHYQLDSEQNLFTWLQMPRDTIYIQFMVFPFELQSHYKRYQPQEYQPDFLALEREKFKISSSPSQDVFGGNTIQKSGSIARGVGFGNNQSLGLQSALNLQLSGQLTSNLQLTAALSDANIPLQASGSTNQLKEFDQVFIQVHNDKLKIIAGDFWLQNPSYSEYMVYKKRGQGLTGAFEHSLQKGKLYSQTSVGISKGKFQRQLIQGKEAVQGPYRLTGANNEPYILVLSGTEKIYIDGKLLMRGQEYDYIIDYNTAELTFTSRQLITKDVRIVAEFQYSDQNYSRSLLQHTSKFENQKIQVWLAAYQEQDLKNQPLQQMLTDAQKLSLSQIGDQLNTAFVPGYENVGFLENVNMYKLTDTLGMDSVFVFSVDPSLAVYRCVFSQVGAQQGDYILAGINASGAYYQWVAPINGVPQGNFAPIRRVETPQRKQMISSGFTLQLQPKWKFYTENALSENDLNLYSGINDANNLGFASKGGFIRNQTKKTDSLELKKTTVIGYRYLGKQFIPIEQFRAVEFDRDWNIRGKQYTGAQMQVELSQQWQHSQNGQAQIKLENFQIDTIFSGQKFSSEGDWKAKGWQAKWDAFALHANESTTQNTFLRQRIKLSKQLGLFQVGFTDDHEWNSFKQQSFLTTSSYQFFDAQSFISYQPKKGITYKIYYRERYDWRSDSTQLAGAAKARTTGLDIKLESNPLHQLQVILGTRQLFILDSSIIDQKPENSAVGRIDYNGKFLKNAFVINTFYELGSGLEQKRRFQYLRVNDGQGLYAWIDYNNDGIKDLNEFELAQFADQAQYIRIFVPSADYATVFSNEWNQSIIWRPEQLWRSRSGVLGVLSKFSNQTKIRIQRKLNEANLAQWANPFATQISDAALLFANAQISNSLFFNRNAKVFSAEYNWTQSQNKTLLANGQDARGVQKNSLNMRWNISENLALETTLSQGTQSAFADYTSGRNYALNSKEIKPQLIYQQGSKVRFNLIAGLTQKQNNPIYGAETSLARSVDLAWKVNHTEQSSITGNLKYIYFDFNGNIQSAVAYEMLEGLRAGANWTWSLNFQKTLGKNLQLNLHYNGRAANGQRVIHTGGLELRAYF
ncbi:MAG: hypothetical protein RLZZ65_323 [Bacteroidota bacterium]|jgi:hypothetical protein